MIEIEGRIFRGRILKKNRKVDPSEFTSTGKKELDALGVTAIYIASEPCSKCRGTLFGLAPHYNNVLEFCLSDQCLKDDAQASKGKEYADSRKHTSR